MQFVNPLGHKNLCNHLLPKKRDIAVTLFDYNIISHFDISFSMLFTFLWET